MATLITYRCKKCGYEVQTEPQGHYSLMSGEYYNFSCHKCKKIVALSADDLSKMGYFPHCPECGDDQSLYSWNPEEGHCPKCNSQMMKVPGTIMMAD